MTKNTTRNAETKRDLLYRIAAQHIYDVKGRGDLAPHRCDREDFIEASVGELAAALEAAYRAGLEAGRKL